ncbi:hypothetical protein AAG747_19390 [Rapidithrix thailandica]|uniref:Uncharacterized protein n=1 Tax=Rapidithrix thailandica TaxID=413964 RepID=A0AAW9RYV2_9BACT
MFFEELSFSILDLKSKQLIALSSKYEDACQIYKVQENLSLLFDTHEHYQGFILENAMEFIKGYQLKKTDPEFERLLIATLSLINSETFEKMEQEDAGVFQELKALESQCVKIKDDRVDGLLTLIDNCFYAYY